MAEGDQRPIIRRISTEEFLRRNPLPIARQQKRTVVRVPSSGGTFTPDELGKIIPPSNARTFKIIRVFGGRYVRSDNPEGLGTEGPFPMSDFPTEDADLSGMEDMDIVKVIFDVGD